MYLSDEKEDEKVEDAIEEKLAPILHEIEELRAYIRNVDLNKFYELFEEESEVIISKQKLNDEFHVNLNNGYINILDFNQVVDYTPSFYKTSICKVDYINDNEVKLTLDSGSGDYNNTNDYDYSDLYIGEFEV